MHAYIRFIFTPTEIILSQYSCAYKFILTCSQRAVVCIIGLHMDYGLSAISYDLTGWKQKKAPSGKAPERADLKVIRTFSVRVLRPRQMPPRIQLIRSRHRLKCERDSYVMDTCNIFTYAVKFSNTLRTTRLFFFRRRKTTGLPSEETPVTRFVSING